jgi:inner membrane protease ATP23
LGCPRPNMNCAECNAQIGGGFEPQNNIVLCCNRILDQSDMDNVLTHELIHAYDGCRVRNLDWHNAHHLACSYVIFVDRQLGFECLFCSLL